METSKVNFNFYDNVAIVFPGCVFIGIIMHYYPESYVYICNIKKISDTLIILIFIILSFIFGHISYILSKAVSDFITEHTFGKNNSDKFIEISEQEQNKIIEYIEVIYKTDFDLKNKIGKYRNHEISGEMLNVKNYCFSLVKDKISNYYIFVSLADFLRSISFLLMVLSITFITDITILKKYSFGNGRNFILIISLLYFSHQVFKRSIRMRKIADGVIYSQFLFEASK
jgi:hypothetical protein